MDIKTVQDLRNYLKDLPAKTKIEFGNYGMYDEYTVLTLEKIEYKKYESFGHMLEIELEF